MIIALYWSILENVNREAKETLYTFLDTSRRYLSGGTAKQCPMPEFSDSVNREAVHRDRREIEADISVCTACALAKTGTKTVQGVGPDKPLVMVIGEGPGAEDDSRGELLLEKMLDAIGLSRNTNCYITNIVKCRPPQNRDPLPEEIASCAHFLDEQIDALEPKAILALGRVAAQYLLKTTTGIGQLRGTQYEYRGIPLVATFHPSALLTDETLKRPAWEDLKKFRATIDALIGDGTPR